MYHFIISEEYLFFLFSSIFQILKKIFYVNIRSQSVIPFEFLTVNAILWLLLNGRPNGISTVLEKKIGG